MSQRFLAFLPLLILSLLLQPYPARAETAIEPPAEAVRTLEATGEAFARVAAAVKPAVVNIATTKTAKGSEGGHSLEPFFNDPFFRHFFGDPRDFAPRGFRQRSLGSGVIIDAGGVILTNNHVVDEADEIVVRLGDGREFKGTVAGKDPKTDLAVIKIDAKDLPFLRMGDSSTLEVGHLVMAVGNPFGLNQTVTTGIVSAKGRANVGIADYEDFIQTDAAINPGNSGGAMVNVQGELVGINTAIFSTSGGYQGIGFAVPTSLVKPVVESLLNTGKVVRGWLGVMIQNVSKELAEQFGLDEATGALVSDVVGGSPAEKAGLKRGDVIVAFQGKTVEDTAQLRNRVAGTAPGTKALFAVVRDGKKISVDVVLGELPADVAEAGTEPSHEPDNAFAGVMVDELTPALRERLNVPPDVSGVVVKGIRQDSAAAEVLRPGDVIIEINRTSIENVEDYRKVSRDVDESATALLLVYRKGSTLFFALSKNP